MPESKEGLSRDTLKVHLDVFKHLTSLGALVSVALLALGERFEPTLPVALVGVVALALTLLLCLTGIFVVSQSVKEPSPSNLAFWTSNALLGASLVLFFVALLTVLDNALRQYGPGLVGWLRLMLGG